jgi:dephospho-CoA kinase
VKEEVERKIARLKKEGVGVVVVDHPLLFEAGFYMKMDRVVVVSAEGQRMRERLRARGMDDKDVERRLSFQVPLEEKEARADYVVRNDGTIDDLTREAALLCEKITEWEEDKHAAQ